MEHRSDDSTAVKETQEGFEPPERRNFLRKSLIGATPLILTAFARPVLGSQCTVSGMMSGNLSAPGDPEVCAGLTPGFWKNHLQDWPAPFEPGQPEAGSRLRRASNNGSNEPKLVGGTPFNSVFTYRSGYYDDEQPPTFLDVMLKKGHSDRYRLGAHAVAALLNATYFETQGVASFGYSPDEILVYWSRGVGPGGSDLKEFYQMLNERGYG